MSFNASSCSCFITHTCPYSSQYPTWVLVTGANGYIAANVVLLLLQKGYHVRGTVRSLKRAQQSQAKFAQFKDKVEFKLVEDITKPDAFEGTLDGISAIFHVASPYVPSQMANNKTDVIDPTINSTVGLLRTAAKAPSVKRVIITSSFAAISSSKPYKYIFTEDNWNPVTMEQAVDAEPVKAFVAAKKLAEKAAFDFVKDQKPHFDIVTICPTLVFGPIVHHIDKLEDLRGSAKLFYDYITGKNSQMAPSFDLYVDVRDLAQAYILALNRQASNQRYLITNGNFDWQEVVDFAHMMFPNQTKAVVGTPGTHPPATLLANNTKSIEHLGMTYTPKDATWHNTITQLLELEKQGL